MSNGYRGSDWRHWDLHVHSPASYHHEFPGTSLEEKWERYLAALQRLEGVAVLGITDYCTLEGYKRVREFFEAGNLPNIQEILPNIEFRLAEATNDGYPINIHVIAAPEIVSELPRVLLGTLEFSSKGERYSCRYEDVVRFGQAYANQPLMPPQHAFNVGAEQFKVNREHLETAFKDSGLLRDRALIAVPNSSGDGNSGLRQSGQRAMRLEIYRMADIIISPNPVDRRHFLGIDGKLTLQELENDYGGPKPCIGGSDAHRLEKIGKPHDDRFTWIKADPTFDGLVQICFEPAHRVRISAAPPTEPIHRVERMRIGLPTDSQLTGSEGAGAEKFCLRGEYEIEFSSGLTCVIGGRGAGKSTLLSLLQEGASGTSGFFEDKHLVSSGTKLSPAAHVEVIVSSSPEEIEFLTQNEIEAFALDHEKLTQAVYRRLEKLDVNDKLKNATTELANELEAMRRLRELVGRREALSDKLASLRAEEAGSIRLLESLNDQNYTTLITRAEQLNQKISAIRTARRSLRDLIVAVERAVSSNALGSPSAEDGAAHDYYSRAEQLRQSINTAITAARSVEDLDHAGAAEAELQALLTSGNQEIATYLAERGISPENARDLTTASDRLTELREEIGDLGRAIDGVRAEEESIPRNPAVREQYEAVLRESIAPVNERLQAGPQQELRRISIDYEFDKKAAAAACRHALVVEENANRSGRQLRDDYVQSACGEVDWENFPGDLDTFADLIKAAGEGETVRRMIEHLSVPGEFERFRLLVACHFADALTYKQLQVRYDRKRLEQASFGQRCSAALLILLIMGNGPIVIDEPEAHLDSALIANVLVDLIKDRKSDRQIIFATHNANFVVNGDSELIHALTIEGEGSTEIEPTSLENKDHREAVLRLEGGPAAFAQREKRYGFRGRYSPKP